MRNNTNLKIKSVNAVIIDQYRMTKWISKRSKSIVPIVRMWLFVPF
ncbi:hypothetical protein [Flavobacterium antarcticum]|nr:hypothetical protein [Flavobacterium antarcticum]